MYKEMMSLDGKIALVTGGNKGLGRSIALALAEAGANVVITGRSKPELESVAHELEALGREVLPVQADVRMPDDIKRVMAQTLNRFKTVDILVNNAGMTIVKPTLEYTLEDWNNVLSTNLTSAFLFCREVGPVMIDKKKGKIINVSSIAGLRGGSGVYIAYSASKGGLVTFTKALAAEWARHKINVNGIAPGSFYTGMSKNAHDNEEIHRKYLRKIPLRRIGDADEIGPLAVYLAAPASDFMTGETVIIDGGMLL